LIGTALSHHIVKTEEAHTNPLGVKSPRVDINIVAVLLYLDTKLLSRMPPPILASVLRLSSMGTKPLGRRHPILSPYEVRCRLLGRSPPRVGGPSLDQTSYFSVEGSSPWRTKPVRGRFHIY
jgi:hypothetical protein